jgi:hypothetical protein
VGRRIAAAQLGTSIREVVVLSGVVGREIFCGDASDGVVLYREKQRLGEFRATRPAIGCSIFAGGDRYRERFDQRGCRREYHAKRNAIVNHEIAIKILGWII